MASMSKGIASKSATRPKDACSAGATVTNKAYGPSTKAKPGNHKGSMIMGPYGGKKPQS